MILRRFMKHVSDQNWFAVGLDVLVVITGIFLGMQVTDWNTDRNDRAREAAYIERLHRDIMETIPPLDVRYNLRLEIQTGLDSLLPLFSGTQQSEALSTVQCSAIFSSHRYSDPTFLLATASELMSTGHLDLIRDAEIKRAIVTYQQWQDLRSDLLRDIQSQRAVLSSLYPELLQFSTDPEDFSGAGESPELGHQCDWAGMQHNIAFRNDLLDNASRHNAYTRLFEQEVVAFRALHDKLDDVLGLSH